MKFNIPSYLKYILSIVVALLLLSIIVVASSYFVVKFGSRSYIYSDANKLPHAKVALILGASVLTNGELSPILKDRVDMAMVIYRAGIVDKILVTGDNGTLEHNEVNPMRNYLLKNNIPDADIFLDHAGFDTYSSVYRARDVFQVSSMIIVSQAFHLPRAVYIARHLGITAYGIEADNSHYSFYNTIREVFADVKAISNLLFDRQPKYLGSVISI